MDLEQRLQVFSETLEQQGTRNYILIASPDDDRVGSMRIDGHSRWVICAILATISSVMEQYPEYKPLIKSIASEL